MKRTTFFLAFFSLLAANLFVYSCKKDNTAAAKVIQSIDTGNTVVDRGGACNEILIGRGVGLTICGIDAGNSCSLCAALTWSAPVVNIAQTFPFANSNVFSLNNPTANPIVCIVSFNCATQNPQFITVQPGATDVYHVDVINGCCVAHAGCTH